MSKETNHTTRRDFIKGLLLGLGLGSPIGAGFLRWSENLSQFHPELSGSELIQQYKQAIEKKYHIRLSTDLDEMRESEAELRKKGLALPTATPEQYPIQWDLARLVLVDRSLAALPPNFYAQNKDGIKFKIMLRDESSSGSVGFNAVGLSPELFHPGNQKQAFIVLMHESIHAKVENLDKETAQETREQETNYHFRRIEEVLGGNFADIHSGLSAKLSEVETPLSAKRYKQGYLSKEEEQELYFYQRYFYGVSSTIPNHFITTLAEWYVSGKDEFAKMYGRLFSPKMVDTLYNFTRDELFYGKEYKQFPIEESIDLVPN